LVKRPQSKFVKKVFFTEEKCFSKADGGTAEPELKSARRKTAINCDFEHIFHDI